MVAITECQTVSCSLVEGHFTIAEAAAGTAELTEHVGVMTRELRQT